MKRMKNAVRIIAALMIAVMVLSTAAFAEEPTDENYEPMDEMIAAEIAGEEEIFEAAAEDEVFDEAAEEEIFEETEWGDAEVADVAEVNDEAAGGAGEEGEGAALVTGGEEIVAVSEEEENEAAEDDAEENEAAQGEGEENEAAEDDGELGMDLLAAFDEADMPEIVEEAEEVDRTAMMATLINEAMDARQDEGINAALDNTFATLARNAMELANPETGVIEVSGKEIVAMTANAAQARFDVSDQQLEGAIGVAALRAETNGGCISALGGDARLMSMVANEGSAEEENKQIKGLMKDYFELGIDSLADTHPAFKALSPLLKGLLGVAFDEHEEDPLENISAKLQDIENELKTVEANLASRMLNTVSLTELGGEYGTIEKTMTVLKDRVGNILGRSISDAEKNAEIAELYKSSVVTDLESAIVGATAAFQGQQNITFNRMSIFDAAYNTACMDVMFSQEAIDRSAPYICQQLATYIAGYAMLDTVYDACEATYGADYLTSTRESMSIRLSGIDRNGNKVSKSMTELCTDYFNRDRYIFVGKSNNTNIRLSDTMMLAQNFARECKMNGDTMQTPDYMKNNPLSDKNVQMIADYCKEKRKCIFQFLLNEMKFDLRVAYNNKTYASSEIRKSDIYLDTHLVVCRTFMSDGWAYNMGFINGPKNSELPQKIYLATGKQYITQKDKCYAYGMGVTSTNYWYYAQGVDATDCCTGKDEKVQIMKRTRDSAPLEKKDTVNDTDYYCTFLFFQGR